MTYTWSSKSHIVIWDFYFRKLFKIKYMSPGRWTMLRAILVQYCNDIWIIPHSIKTERYTYITEEFKLCIFCQENEEHFLFHCYFYSHLGDKLIQKAINLHNNFLHLPTEKQFTISMDDDLVKDIGYVFYSAYSKGRNALYK